MLNKKTPEFRSFEDFCLERELTLTDRNSVEVAIGMFLAGVASETFFPCENRKVHPTLQ